ncbi:hypothetical protein [Accumulibacter sp.]|nr:hypothetical protein [Accumulibacter sp.]
MLSTMALKALLICGPRSATRSGMLSSGAQVALAEAIDSFGKG